VQIDRSTPFGARVHDRLRNERLAWLTTVGADGTPHPKPVWFLWEPDGSILIYSRPNTAKLRHIAANPRVSLNLDGDRNGGDIVVITGSAALDSVAPPANAVPAYVEKYRAGFLRIGMTADTFAAAYSVAIRLTPEKLSGH
jgi:PPOX class probable F420-dependent enzyme